LASVLEIAKRLNREFKDDKLAVKADITPDYERMPTGAFGFDYPLYGGLPLGRIATFAGLFHSGKSTAACLSMAAYQRRFPNQMCVYVDLEHALDLKFQCRMTGLDPNRLIYFNPTSLTGEQVLDAILEFQNSEDIGMIVLDSIPALLPAQSLENDMTKDPGMRGTIAKSLHRFLVAMSSLVNQKNNIFIMVNQVRVSGMTFTGAPIYSEPGGQAPQYYSSIKVRFGTRTFIKGDKVDASDGEGAEGFRLKFSITKNKCGPIARGGGFLSFNYNTGLMWMEDLLEIAYKFEFIQRINNITYQLMNLETGEVYLDAEGKELRGKKKDLEEYIYSNIEFQNEYLAMLNRYISGSSESYGNVLDAREQAEIKEQEESVEAVSQKAIMVNAPNGTN
jgi:RecA/RadA recombinase